MIRTLKIDQISKNYFIAIREKIKFYLSVESCLIDHFKGMTTIYALSNEVMISIKTNEKEKMVNTI